MSSFHQRSAQPETCWSAYKEKKRHHTCSCYAEFIVVNSVDTLSVFWEKYPTLLLSICIVESAQEQSLEKEQLLRP